MMFPRDNVGMLYAGPCSHKEGKRSLMSQSQHQSLNQIQVKGVINDTVNVEHKHSLGYFIIK